MGDVAAFGLLVFLTLISFGFGLFLTLIQGEKP